MAKVIHWVIYRYPTDFPDKYVVRGWTISAGQAVPNKECKTADTLEEARARIPAGMIRLPRSPDDDDTIVETWI